MAEVDWSELPNDLVNLISQLFDKDLDLISFRSVCSMWRRSSISNHHHQILPFKLPRFIKNSLSKHILFLIKPPPPPPQQEQETPLRPWLIRITKNSRGEQLFHPLRPQFSPSPYDFPYVLDFNKFSDVVHLGTNFIIDSNEEEPTTPTISQGSDIHHLMMLDQQREMLRIREKLIKTVVRINTGRRKVVAVTCHGNKPLALCKLNSNGCPTLFHCRKKHWELMPRMSTHFVDICVFKERFYAVNKIGRTVAFGADCSVQLVAKHVDGEDMKFLVESEGELLLVDIYDSHPFGFPGEYGLRLDVFTLDEKEKKWVKLTSLGDRILFLGNEYSFSTTASDLSVAKGNCVIFIDDAFNYFEDMRCGMCVFHLDQCRLSPLSNYPDYSNLFWPPPDWIVKMLQHS